MTEEMTPMITNEGTMPKYYRDGNYLKVKYDSYSEHLMRSNFQVIKAS